MKKKTLNIITVVIGVGLIIAGATTALGGSVPRMTKETLKAKLDDPDLIVLDVRRGRDWKSSEFKIKGAIRVDATKADSWAAKYPKDKTLVLYCA